MRESSRSGLTMVVFAIIMVVFAISFGAPMDGCQQSSGPKRAATVAGDDLMTDEVDIIFNRYGGGDNKNLSEEDLAKEKSEALKALILIHLLADQAEQVGLKVGEEELKRYLLSPLRNAEFQALYGRNGKFDAGYYKRYVEYQLRISQQRYEEFKKNELLAKKFLELAEMQVGLLPGEVDALKALRQTKVNLEYVKFSPALLKARIEPTAEEIDAFIQSDSEKIKTYYDEHKAEYSEPAQVQIRRIYILKPGADAAEEEQKQAAERFAQAKARVMEKGEDFGAVAGELSQDFAKEKQGLMDWTSVENMDQSVAKALEGANPGDVKEVSTDFADMLVKLEGRKEEKVTPIAEVQRDIATSLLRDQKVATISDEMSKALKAKLTDKEKTLKSALEELQTEARGGQPAPAEPVEGEEAPAAEPTIWDAVSVRETGPFSLEGQDLSALFGGQLPPGINLSGMGGWDRVPGIGVSPEIALDAFELTPEQPIPDRVYDVEDSKVIVRLKERVATTEATDEEKAKEQVELSSELRSKRLSTVEGASQSLFLVPSGSYGPWLDKLYSDAIKANTVTFNDRVPMAKVLRDEATGAAATATPAVTIGSAPADEAAPAPTGDSAASSPKK